MDTILRTDPRQVKLGAFPANSANLLLIITFAQALSLPSFNPCAPRLLACCSNQRIFPLCSSFGLRALYAFFNSFHPLQLPTSSAT